MLKSFIKWYMFVDVVENNDRLEFFDISWNYINGWLVEVFMKGVKVIINQFLIFIVLEVNIFVL